MRQYQQEKAQELKNIATVFLKSYYIDEDTEELKPYDDIETPLLLVETIESFKENVFWVRIKNLWVLIGRIPPLSMEVNDIVLFKEKGKWGLFKYAGEEDNKVLLKDGKEQRTTRIDREVLESLELFGKVLRVQEKV